MRRRTVRLRRYRNTLITMDIAEFLANFEPAEVANAADPTRPCQCWVCRTGRGEYVPGITEDVPNQD